MDVEKAMHKVYREYKRQLSQGTTSVTDSDLEIGFNVSHTTLRKDEALSDKEKQYLVAVERADMGSVRNYLEQAEVCDNKYLINSLILMHSSDFFV